MRIVKNNPKYWEFIRQLRNDQRSGFVNQSIITTGQQIDYMKKYNDCYYVCLSDDCPVGFIGSVDEDIRVAVISKMQGRGIGKYMLKEFMKFSSGRAKIKIENTASIKLFESCGFISTGKDENFIYYDIQINQA